MDYNYTQSNLKPTPRLTQTTLTYLTKIIINKISQKKKKGHRPHTHKVNR